MFGLFRRARNTQPNEAMTTYCHEHDIDHSQLEEDIDAPVLSLPTSLARASLCCVFIRFKRMAKEKKGAAFQSSRHGASAGQDMLDALSALQRTLSEAAYDRKGLYIQVLSRMDALMQRYEAEVYDENGFGYGTLVSVKRDFGRLVNNEVHSHE